MTALSREFLLARGSCCHHGCVNCPYKEKVMPRVVRIKDNVPGAVRIDRRTPYGNPYVVGKHGDRDEVCEMFEAYAIRRLKEEPDWLDPLKGKDLACWCAPQRCHGDTLVRLANEMGANESND